MSYEIETEGGTIVAPVTMVNGRLAFALRSDTRETHVTEVTAAGLMDEDGNYVNCDCAEIGPIVLSWTDDEELGSLPNEVDNRFHANVLLDRATTERGVWQHWVETWMAGDDLVPNSDEEGKSARGVDLIEMSSIKNPRNIIG